MSIRRTRTSLEDHYTQVDNAWLRDDRISLKARGLFVQILSHREGWSISIASLVRANPEGDSAIRSALAELIRFGYLIRGERERDESGRLGDYEYTLWGQPGLPPGRNPAVDQPAVDEPTVENPTTKKTIPQEDHLPEPPVVPQDDGFDAIWQAWPRKDSKKAARARWSRLSAKKREEITPLIVAHANAFRQNVAPLYVPYLTSFLKDERWDDPLAVSRERGAYKPEPQAPTQRVIPQGHVPVRDENGQIIGSRPA